MRELATAYQDALLAFLQEAGEAHLKHAYELGRQVLAEGRGMLEVVEMHHDALQAAFGPGGELERMRRAGEFLAECLSPYEMTQRAYGEANATLRRLNDALEGEAQRIARALHDESGQLLAAVHMQLRELACHLSRARRAKLAETDALLERIERQLRDFSHQWHPAILDDYGFLPALQVFAAGFTKRTGVEVNLEGQVAPRLPRSVETAMYRIGQEALNNIARHAHAARVTIRMRRERREFQCLICDDGVGFQVDAAAGNGSRGLGLLGMRERLAGLHGTLRIVSAPNQGTELRISVPLEE